MIKIETKSKIESDSGRDIVELQMPSTAILSQGFGNVKRSSPRTVPSCIRRSNLIMILPHLRVIRPIREQTEAAETAVAKT